MKPVQSWNHTTVSIARGVAMVTITGAGPLNILGTPVITDLAAAVDALAVQEEVRVIVLRGTGDKALIGGADIKEMASLTPATAERFISSLRTLCDSLRLAPIPVIARMAGWCLGGGLEVAMACDIRIASDDARLGMPEVKVGIPSVIHAALLPRLVGQSRAAWLLLTGEMIDAEEARTSGLVHRVVPLASLDAELGRVASLLASYGPAAMRQQKRLLREWEELPLAASIDRSVKEFGAAFTTGEPQRFMQEFLARERPVP